MVSVVRSGAPQSQTTLSTRFVGKSRRADSTLVDLVSVPERPLRPWTRSFRPYATEAYRGPLALREQLRIFPEALRTGREHLMLEINTAFKGARVKR